MSEQNDEARMTNGEKYPARTTNQSSFACHAEARRRRVIRHLWLTLLILTVGAQVDAQPPPSTPSPAPSATATPSPSPAASATPEEETIIPTFETQKLARTYI